MARPLYRKTPQDTLTVRAMASYGIPQREIGAVLGIDEKTLRKHFKPVLAIASTEANAMVAQGLFKAATAWMQPATEGRKPPPLTREAVIAMLFWLKARAGWSERVTIDATTKSTVKATTESTVIVHTAADSDALKAMAQLEALLAGGAGAAAGLEPHGTL